MWLKTFVYAGFDNSLESGLIKHIGFAVFICSDSRCPRAVLQQSYLAETWSSTQDFCGLNFLAQFRIVWMSVLIVNENLHISFYKKEVLTPLVAIFDDSFTF